MARTVCFVKESRNYKYACDLGVKKVYFGFMDKLDRRCEECIRKQKDKTRFVPDAGWDNPAPIEKI